MWFLYFLIIVGVIILDYFIAKEFESIAALKGYTSKKYFWWTFLTGGIGMAMIIALPTKTVNSVENDDLPEI